MRDAYQAVKRNLETIESELNNIKVPAVKIIKQAVEDAKLNLEVLYVEGALTGDTSEEYDAENEFLDPEEHF